MLEELEKKYGFAKHLAQLNDIELVERINREVGNRGWGNARSYFLSCLRHELQQRDFDSSCIVVDDSLRLNQRVELVDNRLQPLGD